MNNEHAPALKNFSQMICELKKKKKRAEAAIYIYFLK